MSKKLFLFIIYTILLSTDVNAQGGTFINPYIGAGITNTATTGVANTQPTVSTINNTIGVNIGRSFGRLYLTTGVGMLTTGNETEHSVSFSNPNSPIGLDSGKVAYIYRHIVVPVKVGLKIKSGKLSIVPEIGVTPAYTLGQWAQFQSLLTDRGMTDKMPSSSYDVFFNRFSIFGTADILVTLKVGKKIAITLSPTYNQMLTNFLKQQPSIPGRRSQYHYSITANAGVLLTL